MDEKKKYPLPGPAKFFCAIMVLDILLSIGNIPTYFDNYAALAGTPYEWAGIIDLVILFSQLVLFFLMIIFLSSRKRAFFVCLWGNLAIKAMVLIALDSLNGDSSQAFSSIIVSIVWILYFHFSDGVAYAFGKKAPLVLPAEAPSSAQEQEPPRAVHTNEGEAETEAPAENAETGTQQDVQKAESSEGQSISKAERNTESSLSLMEYARQRWAGMMKQQAAPLPDQPATASAPHSSRRYCSYCGSMYGPNDSHCPGCGRRVRFVLRIPCSLSFSGLRQSFSPRSGPSFFRSRSFVACALLGVLTVSGVLVLTALWELYALESSSGPRLYQVSVSFENSKPQGAKEYHDEISLDGEIILEEGNIISFSPDTEHEIRFFSEQALTPDSYPDQGVGFYNFTPSESPPRELSFECSAGMKEWVHGPSGTSRYIDSYTRTAAISLSAVLSAETARQISFTKNAGLILSLLLTLLFFVFSYRRFCRKR